jgi:hypothetical protein
MPSDINIIDLKNELRVESVRQSSLPSVVISTAAAGGFAAHIGFRYYGVLASVVAGLCAAALAFLVARRSNRFELRIAHSKFVFRGRIGDKLRSHWSVCPDEIRWLEYQEDTTGPETSNHPGGMYAVLQHRSVCLLPYVDEEQTHRVIDRIENKFPVFRTRWASGSHFGQNFTTLGLSQPDSDRR